MENNFTSEVDEFAQNKKENGFTDYESLIEEENMTDYESIVDDCDDAGENVEGGELQFDPVKDMWLAVRVERNPNSTSQEDENYWVWEVHLPKWFHLKLKSYCLFASPPKKNNC